ncbi:MAG: hypothetical protein JOY78_07000 [Pseudonocardia sp.]|nr:hypothetical protein [Pseudonocardia sp.]
MGHGWRGRATGAGFAAQVPAGAATARPAEEPIFHQPWWLDAVAPGRWDAVTVQRGGQTVARLPFVVRGPRRLRVLSQPPLTPFLGPWIAGEPGAKYARALGDEMALQAQLEAALPAAAAFRQSFAPTVTGCLPFLWAGYRAEVRYTYRLADLSDEQGLWKGLAGNIRREIHKAHRQLQVREGLGVDRFYTVWAKTFQRQGVAVPDRGRLERIEAACAARDARAMLFAVDPHRQRGGQGQPTQRGRAATHPPPRPLGRACRTRRACPACRCRTCAARLVRCRARWPRSACRDTPSACRA